MSIGERLAELRARKKESLQQTADTVQISKAHLWQLEKGITKNPSVDLLKKLAYHYGVPLSFLADVDPEDSIDDVSARAFFRDIQSLSDEQRAVLRQLVDTFKRESPEKS